MSKIRTSKGQNVKSFLRMIRTSKDQNVENQNIEKNVESQISSKTNFDILIFFDTIGNIRTLKVFCVTTYGILPMCIKACVGLG